MKTLSRILFLLLLFPAVGCNDDEDSPGSFLFVENFESSNGVLLSGTEPPGLQIDFPTYRFNKETKVLDGHIDFAFTNNLKLIYGSGTGLSGTSGGGIAKDLSGITQLPLERGIFILQKVEPGGSIVVRFKDSLFTLAVDEEFIDTEIYIDTFPFVGEEGVDTCITEVTNTRTISNFGFIRKENIISRGW